MSGFDIQKQAEAATVEDKGIDVHIHGVDEKPLFYEKDGKELPVTITVAGVHSKIYRRIEGQLRKRKIKPGKFTGQAIYDDNIEKTAGCTLGWAGFNSNGDPIEPTNHNVKMLYERCPWVLDQVLEAMNDHSRFFENESTPPTST